MADYIPAAAANAVVSGLGPCPDCGTEAGMRYGVMGDPGPMRCGRCYDDWAFDGKPELRVEMEAKRDLILSRIGPVLESLAVAIVGEPARGEASPDRWIH